ncbi:hypothetical protein GGR33_005206 [Methylobacterium brachythecii]|uniref:Uncharacterized protein n=2 Tax=Methylobacterium brachythecii TaxID=1176177 RepID=A0A7W6APN6_9HYPH|nr:hypothetical protein [Methylobacterium brachythecii]MBB3905664.1 hypothetical protein [Methylobacterium brachythecii]GLS46937.1 hypothetical protein GCM10007884_49370 [Methylobacterium brachythecii]
MVSDVSALKSEHGNFFAVDRRAWSLVCDLKSISAAAAYLILARGSQGDMRTTSWSVNAIEDRTNIPRLRAKDAIKALLEGKVIEQRRGGTKPQYYLLPPAEIENRRTPVESLTADERLVLEVIASHPDGIEVPTGSRKKDPWPFGSPRSIVERLIRKGLVRSIGGSWSKVAATRLPATPDEADWIWLPNSIVEGVGEETSPIERIRQSQSLAALRLFVDLYHVQSLATDGGVHWRQLQQSFHRKQIGQRADFVVWAFWIDSLKAWGGQPFVNAHMTGQTEEVERADGTKGHRDTGWPIFWGALEVLTSTGLVEFVPHLVDSDTQEGTVLHPLAYREGEPLEQNLTVSARDAALSMLNPEQQDWVLARADTVRVVPVRKHIKDVQLVGLARLRHRAKTTATADWFKRMPEWSALADRYLDLIAGIEGERPAA